MAKYSDMIAYCRRLRCCCFYNLPRVVDGAVVRWYVDVVLSAWLTARQK